MRACPDAWWDDGLFDMEWISEKRRGARTNSVGGVFSKTRSFAKTGSGQT
jgi:hypothetical protein